MEIQDLQIEIVRLQERLNSSEKAKEMQAEEYKRRLDGLNHEADQLKDMQMKYLPRETFDALHKELSCKIESLMFFKENIIGRITMVSGIISFLISMMILFFKNIVK